MLSPFHIVQMYNFKKIFLVEPKLDSTGQVLFRGSYKTKCTTEGWKNLMYTSQSLLHIPSQYNNPLNPSHIIEWITDSYLLRSSTIHFIGLRVDPLLAHITILRLNLLLGSNHNLSYRMSVIMMYRCQRW